MNSSDHSTSNSFRQSISNEFGHSKVGGLSGFLAFALHGGVLTFTCTCIIGVISFVQSCWFLIQCRLRDQWFLFTYLFTFPFFFLRVPTVFGIRAVNVKMLSQLILHINVTFWVVFGLDMKVYF